MSTDGRCGPHCRYVGKCNSGRCGEDRGSRPIGAVESLREVDGETIATVRLGVPTDADVETLRRAMVDAHATLKALSAAPSAYGVNVPRDVVERRRDVFRAAVAAFVEADEARGGPVAWWVTADGRWAWRVVPASA